MSFHLIVSNIGRSQGRGFLTTDAEICDYTWTARINDQVIEVGIVERYDRANPWWVLARRVADEAAARHARLHPEPEITLPQFPGDERPLLDAMRRSEPRGECRVEPLPMKDHPVLWCTTHERYAVLCQTPPPMEPAVVKEHTPGVYRVVWAGLLLREFIGPDDHHAQQFVTLFNGALARRTR